MFLEDVSTRKLRKKGFLNSTVLVGKDMLLLFQIDKDVVLDNHRHPHTQLGYCFGGEFDFEVEGEHFLVTKGFSYLLKSKIFHSAVATTDYYAMDIKRILDDGDPQNKISQDVFKCILQNESHVLCSVNVGDSLIQKISFKHANSSISIKLDTTRKNYVIVSKPCKFTVGDFSQQLEPMGIYSFDSDKSDINIEIDCQAEVVLITY